MLVAARAATRLTITMKRIDDDWEIPPVLGISTGVLSSECVAEDCSVLLVLVAVKVARAESEEDGAWVVVELVADCAGALLALGV